MSYKTIFTDYVTTVTYYERNKTVAIKQDNDVVEISLSDFIKTTEAANIFIKSLKQLGEIK